ncbi:MAG: hypothetical protein ACRD3W_08865, partial [Terriglobales bacterium]
MVQVDEGHVEPNAIDPQDDPDPWRRLAGVGLMIRNDTTKNKWRICTSAQLFTKDGTGAEIPLYGTAAQPLSAIVPARLAHHEQYRAATIDYNQTSVTGAVCLTDAVATGYEITNKDPFQSNNLYTFQVGSDTNSLMLTRLKFGNSYSVAAFMIDAAGGMPNDLTSFTPATAGKAASGAPWQFKNDFNLKALPVSDTAANKVVLQYDYFRNVRVHEPRVRITSGSEIPEGVFPLVREIQELDPATGIDSGNTGQNIAKQPIVLVWNAVNGSGSIEIKPPAIDFDVLERWLSLPVSDDDKTQEHQLFLDYYGNVSVPSNDDKKETWHVDDPAVSGLLIMIDQYDWSSASWQSVDGAVYRIPASTKPGILRHQNAPVSVTFLANADSVSLDTSNAPSLKCHLPKANSTIVRVQVFSLIDKTMIKVGAGAGAAAGAAAAVDYPRFETAFAQFVNLPEWWSGGTATAALRAKQQEVAGKLADYIAIAPSTTLVEAADTSDSALPVGTDVWDNFQLVPGDECVEVQVTPSFEGAPLIASNQARQYWLQNKWRNVRDCSLLRQPWRWQGMPVTAPKWVNKGISWWQNATVIPDSAPDIFDLLQWEGVSFLGLSDDNDTLAIPIHFAASQVAAPSKLPDNNAASYLDSMRSDKRSHYVRYALKLRSR